MEGVLNGYVTNPNPTPTLTPNPNRNPNSNPNQINEKIQKETTLEIDQITKCQFGRWKLVKTASSAPPPFSYTEPFLRAVRRDALAKSITGYHKKMVRKHAMSGVRTSQSDASSEYGFGQSPSSRSVDRA
jgi:hypothetical protein